MKRKKEKNWRCHMSSSSTFTLRGVADLKRNLTDISRDTKSNLSIAAVEEAEMIAERSRNEFVPIREGNLASTIRVESGDLSQGRNELGQFTSGSAIEVRIVAGDETTPQALAIHEHPSQFSPPSWEGVNVEFQPSGRGPKFVERPLNESIGGMAERMGDKILK
jgi:hypothetical protein